MTSSDKLSLRLAEAGGALVRLTPVANVGAAPAWRLVWSDDFDTLDQDKWELIDTRYPTNDSLQDYLPEQIRVEDGKLEILSENKPSRGLPYRSGQIISRQSQRLGRWEVRAKLPGSQGMWPAIWLLPDGPWPTTGEIDIMENRGDQPTITSSTFHWGTRNPDTHDSFGVDQQMAIGDKLVSYPDGFHTFACEWVENQLRFYVDDVHHATFYNDEVGYFLPKLSEPMRLIINTAIGGDFLPAADDDHGLAAAISRRLGPRLRARRGTGHCGRFATAVSTKTADRWPAGTSSAIASTTRRMCWCIEAGAGWHARLENRGSGDWRGQLFRRDSKHQRRWRRAGSCQAFSVGALARGSGRLKGPRLDEDRVLQPLGRLFRRAGDARIRRARDCRCGDADRCLARPRIGSAGSGGRGRGPAVACLSVRRPTNRERFTSTRSSSRASNDTFDCDHRYRVRVAV